MKRLLFKALSLVFLLSTLLALPACGHGGTEVGNPPGPGPQVPSAGSPGMEDDGGEASPTPSPGANLNLDESGDEPEIALNPEETQL